MSEDNFDEMEYFKYQQLDMAVNVTMGVKVIHKVGEGAKVLGTLRYVWNERPLSFKAMIGIFDSTVVPSMLYGCEVWALHKNVKNWVNVLEMKGLWHDEV